jgi:hypothetical protein
LYVTFDDGYLDYAVAMQKRFSPTWKSARYDAAWVVTPFEHGTEVMHCPKHSAQRFIVPGLITILERGVGFHLRYIVLDLCKTSICRGIRCVDTPGVCTRALSHDNLHEGLAKAH